MAGANAHMNQIAVSVMRSDGLIRLRGDNDLLLLLVSDMAPYAVNTVTGTHILAHDVKSRTTIMMRI